MSIETELIDAVKDILKNNVPLIKTVLPWQFTAIDHENIEFPATCLYFDEEGWADRNRLEVLTGILKLETVFWSPEARRFSVSIEVPLLKASIHSAIFESSSTLPYVQKYERIPAEVLIAGDNEIHLLQSYRLTLNYKRCDETTNKI